MTQTPINKIIDFLSAKKFKLDSEIEERNQENIRCNRRIDDNNHAISNLKLLMSGYCDTLEELNNILEQDKGAIESESEPVPTPLTPAIESEEKTEIITTIKRKSDTTKIETDDILTQPTDYNPNDLKPFKTLRFSIDSNENVVLLYSTGIYYSTIQNILKLPYPHQSYVFGNTWHNNNRAAVKLMREYLASTKHDPDRGMYRKGFNDDMTKVSKRSLEKVD